MKWDLRGALLAAAAFLLAAGVLCAQAPELRAAAVLPKEFGVADPTFYRVSAMGFSPLSSATQYEPYNGSKRCLSNNCFFGAALPLPSGSKITTVVLEACDDDAGFVALALYRCTGGGGICTQAAFVDTGTVATPGCSYFFQFLTGSEVTVDANVNTYMLQAQVGGSMSNDSFRSASVWYERQVSPAPETATFNDVPTGHPFFQFVEALVASGITAGCGAGNYCPDKPLTRGQMAVFLSKALGLYWPN